MNYTIKTNSTVSLWGIYESSLLCNFIKKSIMSKEKDNKKKSDKTVALKTTKEKRADKVLKRQTKENAGKDSSL